MIAAAPPRHVLLTADAVGGVWTYALDLAEALLARDVAVTLAVLGPAPTPERRRAAEKIRGLAIVDTRLPLDWMSDDPNALRQAGQSLAALAAGFDCDLIHLNSPALAAEARFPAPVVGGCHSCLASWWAEVRGGEMPEDFRLRTEGLRRGYRACDRLIAPSWAFMQTTAALYGVAPEAVRNGRRAPSSARVDKEPLVLTSGRLWDEGKNVAVLDRAAARMRSPVLAAGDLKGPQGQSSHFGHALALGRLSAPALAAQLERASVFASMSLYEPFGLGVLEAAQAGCALVLSDIPTFRELWGGVAAFVPAHDDVALAEALDALVENPAEARERGAAAAERAGKFTIDAMVAGTLRVYGQALAAHAPCPEAAA